MSSFFCNPDSGGGSLEGGSLKTLWNILDLKVIRVRKWRPEIERYNKVFSRRGWGKAF